MTASNQQAAATPIDDYSSLAIFIGRKNKTNTYIKKTNLNNQTISTKGKRKTKFAQLSIIIKTRETFHENRGVQTKTSGSKNDEMTYRQKKIKTKLNWDPSWSPPRGRLKRPARTKKEHTNTPSSYPSENKNKKEIPSSLTNALLSNRNLPPAPLASIDIEVCSEVKFWPLGSKPAQNKNTHEMNVVILRL